MNLDGPEPTKGVLPAAVDANLGAGVIVQRKVEASHEYPVLTLEPLNSVSPGSHET
jgi:hypothetical protein